MRAPNWNLAGVALSLLAVSFLLTGCIELGVLAVAATARGVSASSDVKEKAPEKSQLEIREIQTRMFDTTDAKSTLKTMLAVLQDEGFVVKEANVDLGFLTAERQLDVQTKDAAFWGAFFDRPWKKNATIEATANVAEYGKQIRVRVNFQEKVHDSDGKVATVEVIEDPKFYQEFFAKVDKGLFIDKERL